MQRLEGPRTRTRRWAAPVVVLVLGAAGAVGVPAAQAQVVDTGTDGGGSATVLDDPSCTGSAAATVTGSFSVRIQDLLGGPLAGVTVRNDASADGPVVASVVVALDGSGAGCADLPPVDPGSYVVQATAGDARAIAPVVVEAPPEPTPVEPSAEPSTPPPPDPTPTPEPTLAPPDPTPGAGDPVPDPSTSTEPAVAPSPDPAGAATTAQPGGGTGLTHAGSTPAPDGARPGDRQRSSASPSASTSAAAHAAPSPTPSPSEEMSHLAGPTEMLRAVLTSSDRPTAVTVAGFVLLEVVGGTLLVAFVVLVVSRRPRRRE
ncbi:MAG TPA: hypothetical protein VFL59_00425 [Candidatus Nanopelagicales bacterium]|nr:hypothetical protein [Candidatus Nanopelagicales bacterium]